MSFAVICLKDDIGAVMKNTEYEKQRILELEIAGLDRAIHYAKQDIAKNRKQTYQSKYELVRFFAKGYDLYELSLSEVLIQFERLLVESKRKLARLQKQ